MKFTGDYIEEYICNELIQKAIEKPGWVGMVWKCWPTFEKTKFPSYSEVTANESYFISKTAARGIYFYYLSVAK